MYALRRPSCGTFVMDIVHADPGRNVVANLPAVPHDDELAFYPSGKIEAVPRWDSTLANLDPPKLTG